MTEVFNWDKFQIPHTGMVDDDTKGIGAQTRPFEVKLSNFGALNVGAVRSSDRTKSSYAFADKDNLSDWSNVTPAPFSMSGDYDDNPYQAGTSIKKVRDEQFVRMGMSQGGNPIGTVTGSNDTVETGEVSQPGFDVSDTNAAKAGGMSGTGNESIKNYPTEGWRSFGGKYDFHTAYQGS
jgi:hypothetical protein